MLVSISSSGRSNLEANKCHGHTDVEVDMYLANEETMFLLLQVGACSVRSAAIGSSPSNYH
jgi:hypothetical protein